VTTVDVDFLDELGRLALFADLPKAELETIVLSSEEVSYREGEWIIRQGDAQSDMYVIVEGEVAVVIDDEDRRVLSKGAFFGEVSVLLGEPASASIVTRTPLSCLVVPGAEVPAFLISHPQVTYRMLKAEARRLRTASEWPT
jgi:CRP/FNR family cyclic AMP-dependent transcriptional regulator